jgi:hypothetical protein
MKANQNTYARVSLANAINQNAQAILRAHAIIPATQAHRL